MKKTIIIRILSGLLTAWALLSCSGTEQQTIQLQSEADLAGLRVATITGSCYDMELSDRKDITLQRYNTDSDVLQSLLNGKADVAVTDEVVYNSMVQKENGVKIALYGDQNFPTGFLFRKDEKALADTMSFILSRMEKDGSLQQEKDFWLTDRFTEVDSYTHIPAETSGTPIRVAVCTMSAPVSFQVEGEWYGIEIDLLRELGKELHRPLDFRIYDVGAGILAVKTGVADVLCGCIFITPEREEEFLFSHFYHNYRPGYFVLDRDARAQNKLGWIQGFKKSVKKNLLAEKRWKFITDGLLETIKISILAILLGSILGVGLYVMGRSRHRWMRSFAQLYQGFIAGIPELVLLLILFYVVFSKTGLPADMVAVVDFAMFFASGASDIYESSLSAIPHGQTEAGLALGFTPAQTFFHIVLPQALRHGLPLYKGQCVSILKGTSIVGYIAIQDLTRAGDIIRSRTFDAVIPLLVVTLVYFLLVWLIGVLLKLASPKEKVL